MNLTNIYWKCLLIIGAAVQLLPSAAESPLDLTCHVIQQPDGGFMYLLSRRPSSLTCKTCWEDQNKTVIARFPTHGSTSDPLLVQNLTNQFIITKDCWNYLHHIRDCLEAFEEAHCRANCSLHLDKDPTTVNSTLTCVFGSWCPDQLTVGLGIAGIVVAAVVGLCIWKFICNRRRSSVAMTTSYTPANEQIKMEVDHQVDIVQV